MKARLQRRKQHNKCCTYVCAWWAREHWHLQWKKNNVGAICQQDARFMAQWAKSPSKCENKVGYGQGKKNTPRSYNLETFGNIDLVIACIWCEACGAIFVVD